MSNPIWHTRWAIAEGCIPAYSHGPEPQLTSHETICLLNTSNRDARIEQILFDGGLRPVQGELCPDLSRPGLGLDFKRNDAQRYAV